MIEELQLFDTSLFFWINERHNSFFDIVMYWASSKFFWIPFYLYLSWIIYSRFKRSSIYIFLVIGLVITISDQLSSTVIKNAVLRLRPSHEIQLAPYIHLSEAGPGGKYGFVSSHAANAAALTIFLVLLLPSQNRKLKIGLVFWGLLVSYSRIYNGVHYPFDVFGGIIVGLFSGLIGIVIIRFITGENDKCDELKNKLV